MFGRMSALVVAVSLIAPVSAAGRTFVDQLGKYKLELPSDYVIVKQGQSQKDGAFRLFARSPRGNVKVFVRSMAYGAPDYDFYLHFKRWEAMLKQRGIYDVLKPITPIRQVRGNDRVAYYRVLDGIGRRLRTRQPFRVFALGSHSFKAKRVFTFTIAAHTDFFIQHRDKIMSLARSFAPFDVMGTKGAGTLSFNPKPVKRISVRGLLAARRGRAVGATQRGTTVRPPVRPVVRLPVRPPARRPVARPAARPPVRPAPGVAARPLPRRLPPPRHAIQPLQPRPPKKPATTTTKKKPITKGGKS